MKKNQGNRLSEKELFLTVRECIEKHQLQMKLIKAQMLPDGSKTFVFYTADGRVDFRELLKTLAAALHCRIEMRQIGSRDAAKMLGGIGICGRPVCCVSFLADFEPVSLKVARKPGCCQDTSRLTGICGKLRCCHTYEDHRLVRLGETETN
jgi:cell fate regulator YaaT (PSP1 superfamily)